MAEAVSPLRGLVRGESVVTLVVDEYLTAVADHVYLPYPLADCRAALHTVFSDLIEALGAQEFSPVSGARFGHMLVDLQVTTSEGAAAAGRAIASLPDVLFAVPSSEVRQRASLLLAEFVGGYAQALTRRIIDGQAVVQRASDTARWTAVEGERQAQARLRVMFEHARSAVFVADEDGHVLEASPVMSAMMESNRALLGPDNDIRPLIAADPSDVTQAFAELAAADDDSVTRFIEQRPLHTSRGDEPHANIGRWALSRVRSQDDRPALIVGVGHDISELRALHAQLSHLANHDPLTGLPNRRQLADDLDTAHTTTIGFCLIDLDGFKSFNDRLGHATGDQLLVATTRRMQSALGGTGTLYRVGGDEFAVLVSPPFSPRDVSELVHRSLSTPVELPHPDGEAVSPRRIRIGASIGVTVAATREATVEALISDADTGLYRSKEARRA